MRDTLHRLHVSAISHTTAHQANEPPSKMSHPLKVCRSIEDVDKLTENVVEHSGCKFVVLQKQKFYGSAEWMPLPEHRVFYEHPMPKGAIQIPYDGTPFVFVGKKVLGCHHGGHKSKTTRLKYEQYTGDQPGTRKLRPSKKRNCPAKIFIVQIAKFPDYKITTNDDAHKRFASMKLREDLKNRNEDVRYEIFFIVRDALLSEHAGHLVPAEDEALPKDEQPFYELLNPNSLACESVPGKVLAPDAIPKRRGRKRKDKSQMIVIEVFGKSACLDKKADPPESSEVTEPSVSPLPPADERDVGVVESVTEVKVEVEPWDRPPLEGSEPCGDADDVKIAGLQSREVASDDDLIAGAPAVEVVISDDPPPPSRHGDDEEDFLIGLFERMQRVPSAKRRRLKSEIVEILDKAQANGLRD